LKVNLIFSVECEFDFFKLNAKKSNLVFIVWSWKFIFCLVQCKFDLFIGWLVILFVFDFN